MLEVERLWPPFFGGRRLCSEVNNIILPCTQSGSFVHCGNNRIVRLVVLKCRRVTELHMLRVVPTKTQLVSHTHVSFDQTGGKPGIHVIKNK